jgi:hypothetical protein
MMTITWSSSALVGPSLGIMIYQASPPLSWISIMSLSVLAAVLVLATTRRRGAVKSL